ncbi:hypothetical protein FCK90_14455 [Kocuria coralli]|uniref:Uncharacterized protein n=1 Tax=Kocuria coralli TaxID=1461025 RepID=A0A5J5KU12_9MICC|nr:hypothetical protein [Kocuria coralli]KAA9393002.1 hypothetical protein FCK90_14455 [Kocuria coralli]
MPQSTIKDVWSAIAQHTRATGRASTIVVLDGSEQLRLWRLAPDGARTQLDVEPGARTETADFTLSLSPWMMSVPRANGPDVREVSTLAVARAQAGEAATAGGVELILQTAGTDADTAETVAPAQPETIEAIQDLQDEEADLFDELADDEPEAAPDEYTRRFRRRAIIGGTALALFLGCSLAAGGWALVAGTPQAPPAAAPTTAAPSPNESQATDDPSRAAPIESQAQAPAGFSGTATWEVIGATDQRSGLSRAGTEAGAVSGRTLDLVDTDSGELLESLTLPHTPAGGPYPLASPTSQGGMMLPADGSVMTWSPSSGLMDIELPEDHRLVTRGTTAFTVPQNHDTRPEAIQLLTPGGLTEITSPGGSSSPIGPAEEGFLWASNSDGGTLIRATNEGEVEDQTRLIGPASNTTISQWLGANDDYAAAIWANNGTGSTMTIHDAETGRVVDSLDMGSTGAGAGLRIVPSHEGDHLMVGARMVDLSTGRIGEQVEGISTSNRSLRAVPGGWIASQTDGTPMLISTDGQVQASPAPSESLLGIADSGDLVVDQRGALAAFTPAPDEGESNE